MGIISIMGGTLETMEISLEGMAAVQPARLRQDIDVLEEIMMKEIFVLKNEEMDLMLGFYLVMTIIYWTVMGETVLDMWRQGIPVQEDQL